MENLRPSPVVGARMSNVGNISKGHIARITGTLFRGAPSLDLPMASRAPVRTPSQQTLDAVLPDCREKLGAENGYVVIAELAAGSTDLFRKREAAASAALGALMQEMAAVGV